MIYLLSSGENEDWRADAIVDGPERIDFQKLRTQFEQEIGMPTYPEHSESYEQWSAAWDQRYAFIEARGWNNEEANALTAFLDWIVERHDCRLILHAEAWTGASNWW